MSCMKTKIDGKKDKVIVMLRYSLKHFESVKKKKYICVLQKKGNKTNKSVLPIWNKINSWKNINKYLYESLQIRFAMFTSFCV